MYFYCFMRALPQSGVFVNKLATIYSNVTLYLKQVGFVKLNSR